MGSNQLFSDEDEAYIVDAVNKNEMILLVGAGFSVDAKNEVGENLPSAIQLASLMNRSIIQRNYAHGFNTDNVKDLRIVAECFYRLNKDNPSSIDNFFKRYLKVDPAKIPEKYYQIKKANWKRIYTTNYDDLLERVYGSRKNGYVRVVPVSYKRACSDLTSDETLNVVYLNGDLNCNARIEEGKNFIVTDILCSLTDYTANPDPILWRDFIDKFCHCPVIILGSRLYEDPFYSGLGNLLNKTRFNPSTRPRSFIINKDNKDQQSFEYDAKFNLQHVNGTTDDFLEWLSKRVDIVNKRLIDDREGNLKRNRSERLKSIEHTIRERRDNNIIFPSYDDFISNKIKINDELFTYISNRFKNEEGPVLFEGRWSTGKTISALRIGIELLKTGEPVEYLDFRSDPAGEDAIKGAYGRIIEKRDNNDGVLIIDNVHLYPEITYKSAKEAINKKLKCIFIGRPIPKEARENEYYYPRLFAINKDPDEETDSASDTWLSSECPKVIFKPGPGPIREMFEIALIELGMIDQKNTEKIDEFARSIAYNLPIAKFHVSHLQSTSKWIYTINNNDLYNLLKKYFKVDSGSEELYIIAALAYLDCKTDGLALFGNLQAVDSFVAIHPQLTKNNYGRIIGLHATEGKMILDVALKMGLIRTLENGPISDFDLAFKHLVIKYLNAKPTNIYEIFICLHNHEFENKESGDLLPENIDELIYELLTNDALIEYYPQQITANSPGHYSLINYGRLANIVRRYGIDNNAAQKIINRRTVIELFERFKEKLGNRQFYITWHFKYAWSAVKNLNSDAAEWMLRAIPEDAVLDYGTRSLRNLCSVLEMAIHHDYVAHLVEKHTAEFIPEPSDFEEKLKHLNELRLMFFLRHALRLSESHGLKNIFIKIKDILNPDMYVRYVRYLDKSHKFTSLSFKTAKNILGNDYVKQLESIYDQKTIYDLSFNKPIEKIKLIINRKSWKQFIDNDFTTRLKDCEVKDLSKFLVNIVLHNFYKNYVIDLSKSLMKPQNSNIVLNKLLSSDEQDVSNFFWQLKSLDVEVFDKYFDGYYQSTETDDFISELKLIDTIFFYSILIHNYSYQYQLENTISYRVINKCELAVSKPRCPIKDKVHFGAILYLLGKVSEPFPYSRQNEKVRLSLILDRILTQFEEERRRFEISDINETWWTSKMILLSLELIGINSIDHMIFSEKRLEEGKRKFSQEAKYVLNILESQLENNEFIGNETYIAKTLNKVSIIENAIDILDN